MTFDQLTRVIAENHKLTHVQAKAITKDVFSTIADTIKQGEKVRVQNFGIFSAALANERKLSAAMGGGVAPAHTRPKFKPSKALKDSLNA